MLAFESTRRWGVMVLANSVLVVGFSGVAWAQSAPPPADAPAAEPAEPAPHINLTGNSPKIDLSTPPPPAPIDREFRRHEGFYLRVGGGLGAIGADADFGGFDASSGGTSLELEALVGGGPAPGLAIGGGLLASLQLGGEWEDDDVSGDTSADLTTLIIGPFADGYPHPGGGLHFGGLLGLASVSFDGPGGGGGSDALGVGGAGWIGYDVWVAPEWSIGASLRLDALRATNSDDDVTISKIGGTLAVSVVYN